MENPEIKACPFCGEEWCSLRNAGNNGVLRQVYCRDVDCGARGPVRPSDDHAIAAWNNRAGGRKPATPGTASIKALASATGSLAQLPPLEGEVKEILGKTCLSVAGIGRRLDAIGLYKVPRRVEEEQAAALHWMLNLYLKRGNNWRVEGERILKNEAPENSVLTNGVDKTGNPNALDKGT